MKIEKVQGCTSHSFTIDGKKWIDCSKEEQKQIKDKMLEAVSQAIDEGCLRIDDFITILEYDDEEYGETCEQCGDYVITTVWDI